MTAKRAEKAALDAHPSTAEIIRDREELAEQIRALGELAEMATSYGHDVTRPAARSLRYSPPAASASRSLT